MPRVTKAAGATYAGHKRDQVTGEWGRGTHSKQSQTKPEKTEEHDTANHPSPALAENPLSKQQEGSSTVNSTAGPGPETPEPQSVRRKRRS